MSTDKEQYHVVYQSRYDKSPTMAIITSEEENNTVALLRSFTDHLSTSGLVEPQYGVDILSWKQLEGEEEEGEYVAIHDTDSHGPIVVQRFKTEVEVRNFIRDNKHLYKYPLLWDSTGDF